ncbi:hypothetical protein LWI28_010526 [Acer negundo]|uniref:Uncharacterized protein n=1 Tax=Acer negundo TaxID=4023 RepID=A0AAD5JGD9_ACENE|nr:hypothetical protein LWI28_010526 [Acer negundo]
MTKVVDKASKGKNIKRLEIPVDEIVYGGMTKTEVVDAAQKELKLAEQDLKMEHTKDKKTLWSLYVYEMREKIFDPIENRYKEEEAGAEATRDLLKCAMDYKMVVGSLPSSVRDADMQIHNEIQPNEETKQMAQTGEENQTTCR